MAQEEVIQTVRETPEIEAYRIGLLEAAKKLADQGITLPTQQVAGLTGLQKAAIEQAQTTGLGAFLPYIQSGGQFLGQAGQELTGAGQTLAGAQQTLGGAQQTLGGVEEALRAGAGPLTEEMIQSYMNPYQQAVADEINRAYDIQQQGSTAGAIGSGAFGGSRAQIAQSEIDRNRASALAQAQAQNFMQAQRAAERGLARQTQLGQGIAALAGQQAGMAGQQAGFAGQQAGFAGQRGQLGLQQAALGETLQSLGQRDIDTAYRLGSLLQAQDQAKLDAERQSKLAQMYEPYQRLGFLSDIYSKTPTTQQTITQSTSPNVSPFQQYLGLGIAGLSAAAGAQKAGLFG